jgi:pantoate--beta-alanine ligase
MRIVRNPIAMQRLSTRMLRRGIKIGFVPTMGYLHPGHISLVRHARRHAGTRGLVVVSIYVNPTQFGPAEDFARYPRDLGRDVRLCREAGVDILFTPSDIEMYPGRDAGSYSTYVNEEALSMGMEGAVRPGHFRGVTTVVAKLLNVVRPDVAVFGAKDWQQAAVIRRMATDLNIPSRIVVAPTIREADGLAMSSRNNYLTGPLRSQATVLWRAICQVRERVRSPGARPLRAAKLRGLVERLVQAEPDAELDYVEFFDPENLKARAVVMAGTQMALAVRVGHTRLIDNATL